MGWLSSSNESHSALDINYKSQFILRFDKNLRKSDYAANRPRRIDLRFGERFYRNTRLIPDSPNISLFPLLYFHQGRACSLPKMRLENVNLIGTHIITNASRIRASASHWELLSRLRIVLDFNRFGITGAYKCRVIYDRSRLMSAQIRAGWPLCPPKIAASRYPPFVTSQFGVDAGL
jgi:hypothetical protein